MSLLGPWVLIRSWHLTSGLVSRGGMVHTICGRWASKDATERPKLVLSEKSCESCLRLKVAAE